MRLEERETCRIRLANTKVSEKTKEGLKQERKDQIVEEMTRKFGKIIIGIHGQEIPKFNENPEVQEWWKVGRERDDNEDQDDSIYQLRNQMKSMQQQFTSS